MLLFKPKQVAIFLWHEWNSTTRKRVYRWIKNKNLESVKDGKHFYIPLASIRKLTDSKITNEEVMKVVESFEEKNNVTTSLTKSNKIVENHDTLNSLDHSRNEILKNQKKWFVHAFKVQDKITKGMLAREMDIDTTAVSRFASARQLLLPEHASKVFSILGIGNFDELYGGIYKKYNMNLEDQSFNKIEVFNSKKSTEEMIKDLKKHISKFHDVKIEEIDIKISMSL